ncbi:uncharacterized protein LOC110053657 [Orbicella faveolata]|uniref:uncharacterized protein LOC110053657 n=1 Tax=Orbicella faveolata TaxID=48498 RepID=UPI0009E4FFC1|nr:uncharacterized protein LOC110053657 [Orbicella faveolata]
MDVHEMELDEKLRTFWELESIGIKQEENSALETFIETITLRNQRYEGLSQKLEQFEEYDRVIKDQLDRGIIERVDQSEKAQPCHQIHYLPHHCVVREDKSTTKLRIVYNASARENGPPLNDCLHTGPPLTPDILDILIRFKVQPIALVADIEKAFLMIAVKKEDRELFE